MSTLSDENCFWSFLQPHSQYNYCENQICSIIQQPANTWSNIGYLIAAIVIYKSILNVDKRVKNLFFSSSLVLFVGSTFFHMSDSSIAHKADLFGMFSVSLTGLTLAYQRLTQCSDKRAHLFLFVNLIASMLILIYLKVGSQLFFLQIVAAVILEYKMRNSDRKINTKRMVIALSVQILAYIIWVLDVRKIICDPENHIISGHAVWHLLSAITIYLFFTAYEKVQFKK